jgi:hypothetical protein
LFRTNACSKEVRSWNGEAENFGRELLRERRLEIINLEENVEIGPGKRGVLMRIR